jgi:dienelactone hydrolase
MKKVIILLLVLCLVSCQTNTKAPNKTEKETENEITVKPDETVIEASPYDDAIDGKYYEDGQFPLGKSLIRFPSKDGAMITGDLNLIDNSSPLILLFHQATASRGEYIETAKKLNELGYNTLAVDQRSGEGINDVENMTYKRLSVETSAFSFKEAIVDVEATIEYASNTFDMPMIALGSSYSASILCVIGQSYESDLLGLVLFSPGQNMYFENKPVSEMASDLMLPLFLTCGSHESYEPLQILKMIPSENVVTFFPERTVIHGSRLLWETTETNELIWEAMMDYIQDLTQAL